MSNYTVTWAIQSTAIFHEVYSGEILIDKVGDVSSTIVNLGSDKTHDISVIDIDFYGNRSVNSNVITEIVPLSSAETIPTSSDWLQVEYADVSVDGEIMPTADGAAWIYGGRVFVIPITTDFTVDFNIKQYQATTSGLCAFGLCYGARFPDFSYSPWAVYFNGLTDIHIYSYGTRIEILDIIASTSDKYTIKGVDDTISFLINDIEIYEFAEKRTYETSATFSYNRQNRGFTNIKLTLT